MSTEPPDERESVAAAGHARRLRPGRAASEPVESELRRVGGEIRRLAANPPAAEPALWLTHGLEAGPAPAWRRYIDGEKPPLSSAEWEQLKQRLDQAATGPDELRTRGLLIDSTLSEVLVQLEIPRGKAASLFVESLRQSLLDLAWQQHTARRATWEPLPMESGSTALLLTKNTLEQVFSGMERDAAQTIGSIDGAVFARLPAGMAQNAEHDERTAQLTFNSMEEKKSFSWLYERLSRAAARRAEAEGGSASEAERALRLLDRLMALARRHAVDLVSALEHYQETARRIIREAEEARAQRQMSNDRRAIDGALTALDLREVERFLDALPLSLHLTGGGEGSPTLATPCLPRFDNATIQRSVDRFCRSILRLPAGSGHSEPSELPAAAAVPVNESGAP